MPTFLVILFGFFTVFAVIYFLRAYEAHKLVRLLGPYSKLSDQAVEQQRVSGEVLGAPLGVRFVRLAVFGRVVVRRVFFVWAGVQVFWLR